MALGALPVALGEAEPGSAGAHEALAEDARLTVRDVVEPHGDAGALGLLQGALEVGLEQGELGDELRERVLLDGALDLHHAEVHGGRVEVAGQPDEGRGLPVVGARHHEVEGDGHAELPRLPHAAQGLLEGARGAGQVVVGGRVDAVEGDVEAGDAGAGEALGEFSVGEGAAVGVHAHLADAGLTRGPHPGREVVEGEGRLAAAEGHGGGAAGGSLRDQRGDVGRLAMLGAGARLITEATGVVAGEAGEDAESGHESSAGMPRCTRCWRFQSVSSSRIALPWSVARASLLST